MSKTTLGMRTTVVEVSESANDGVNLTGRASRTSLLTLGRGLARTIRLIAETLMETMSPSTVDGPHSVTKQGTSEKASSSHTPKVVIWYLRRKSRNT